MYYIYDENDRLLGSTNSPVAAELIAKDIKRREHCEVYIVVELG